MSNALVYFIQKFSDPFQNLLCWDRMNYAEQYEYYVRKQLESLSTTELVQNVNSHLYFGPETAQHLVRINIINGLHTEALSVIKSDDFLFGDCSRNYHKELAKGLKHYYFIELQAGIISAGFWRRHCFGIDINVYSETTAQYFKEEEEELEQKIFETLQHRQHVVEWFGDTIQSRW